MCAEHKKPLKLAKHLEQIQEGAKGMRNPPRVLIFANRHAALRCGQRCGCLGAQACSPLGPARGLLCAFCCCMLWCRSSRFLPALPRPACLPGLPACPACLPCRIKTVRFLQKQVQEAGHRVALLHGERSQEEREAAMADFRSGKAQVCVPAGCLWVGSARGESWCRLLLLPAVLCR